MGEEEDWEDVGLCAEFQGLSWLASAPEDALLGVRSVVVDVVEEMNEQNESIPEPLASRFFSGKFMVSVPPSVHCELSTKAAKAGEA